MNISNDVYCIGKGVAAIRGKNNLSVTPFLEYLMYQVVEMILSEARGSGSTFPSINGDRLKSILVALPCIEEKEKIMEEISETETLIKKGNKLSTKTTINQNWLDARFVEWQSKGEIKKQEL